MTALSQRTYMRLSHLELGRPAPVQLPPLSLLIFSVVLVVCTTVVLVAFLFGAYQALRGQASSFLGGLGAVALLGVCSSWGAVRYIEARWPGGLDD